MDQRVADTLTPRAHERGSELTTLVMISAAHFVSHFHIVVLASLFPFLRTAFGVDYIQLGVALTIFGVVSGVTQGPMGFLSDRIGPKTVLIIGLVLGSAALASLAAITTYPWLLVAAALAGLANSVYHPCDYAILSSAIGGGRMGRAFSIHTFAGFLGGAVTPVTMFFIATSFGLKAAFMIAGALGFAVAAVLALPGSIAPLRRPAPRRTPEAGDAPDTRGVFSPQVIGLMFFFMLLGLSTGGVQSFGLVAFVDAYGVSLSAANVALTAFLAGTAVGVLVGGVLADRTRRHGELASIAFLLGAAFMLVVAVATLGPVMLTLLMFASGFLSGVIAPSRDMLVRAASPPGAEGRVFGIVSIGFNLSGAVGPILYGMIMDQGEPRLIFAASVAFILLGALFTYGQRTDNGRRTSEDRGRMTDDG